MIVAGEADQLSPIQHTYDLFDLIKAPRQLVVYQDADHSIGNASSAELGPARDSLVYDWLRDRADGEPVTTEKVMVDSSGTMHSEPF